MHRLRLLLLPYLVAAALASDTSGPAQLGQLWTDSTTAEASKDYTAALRSMQAFKEKGGDGFLASLRIGWLKYQSGQYNQAESAYARAQALKPTSLNAALGLLNAVQAQLDPRKTALAAEGVLKVQSTNYRAMMALAGLSFAQKDYRKAAAAYDRTLPDPDSRAWERFMDDGLLGLYRDWAKAKRRKR